MEKKKMSNKMKKSLQLIFVLLILASVSAISQDNSGKNYSIVIGSMGKIENAEKLQDEATLKGYEVRIENVKVRGKLFNRVLVGNYTTFSEAKNNLNKIRKDFKIRNAWIIEQGSSSIPIVKKEKEIKPNLEKEKPIAKTPVEQKVPEAKIVQTTPKKVEEKPIAPKKVEEPKKLQKIETPKADTIKISKKVEEPKKKEEPKAPEKPIVKQEEKKDTVKKVEITKVQKKDTTKVVVVKKTDEKNIIKVDEKPLKIEVKMAVKDTVKKEITKAPELKKVEAPKPISIKSDTTSVKLTDSLLLEFAKQHFKLIISIRNYEYIEANKFVHPDHHFYVLYNQNNTVAVREFSNFEKFFAVFGAFSAKGNSFDFSQDIEKLLVKKAKVVQEVNYNCTENKFDKEGLLYIRANGSSLQLLESVRAYYKSFGQELLPDIVTKVTKVDDLIQLMIIDTEGQFIEGMYFGLIDGKWYLLVIDLRLRCK